MIFNYFKKVGFLNWVMTLLLVFIMVLMPVSHSFERQQAEATTVDGWVLVFKEYIFDNLAYVAINVAIQEITASLVEWINNDFQGRPKFLEDFEGFMLDIGDQMVGDFINSTELGFLCSPFELDVKLGILFEYQSSRDLDVSCTLTDVVGNIEDFTNGDFAEGGWDGWFEMTQVRKNNPHGALLEATEYIELEIASERGRESKKLEFGQGFFNFDHCEEVPQASGDMVEVCETKTPGKVVEDSLNEALNLGNERLLMADEINEIFVALVGYVMRNVVASDEGLAGADTSGWRDTESGGNFIGHVQEIPKMDEGTFGGEMQCNEDGTDCTISGEQEGGPLDFMGGIPGAPPGLFP
ncbi:hypothetical protein OAD26_00030 [bacterium]|nr:hypothetical protein [bacterium]